MSTPALPSYTNLQSLMADANTYLGAAELHGLLCGFICHGDLAPDAGCMNLILNDADEQEYDQLVKQIKLIFGTSVQQLSDFGFEFELLLPDDESSFTEQLEAVSQWSEGFILGMEFAQKERRKTYSTDVKEMIEDIRKIASAYQRFLENKGEENEEVIMEIIEHLRMGALFIFTELNAAQTPTRH